MPALKSKLIDSVCTDCGQELTFFFAPEMYLDPFWTILVCLGFTFFAMFMYAFYSTKI